MKSSNETLEFIDNIYQGMIDRPTMYASSAEGLFEIILMLEGVRGFIVDNPDASPAAFAAFVCPHGWAPNCIWRDLDTSVASGDMEMKRFNHIATLFRNFLENENRIPKVT